MKYFFMVFAWALNTGILSSQSFSAHPPGLHWQKLNTGQGNIFFPSGMESKAYLVASIINHAYDTDTTLGKRRFKINIVLQNQTVYSNGYVGIGPLISEFYLTPPHDPYILGPIDWTEALATHEYRHVIQAMNSRVGINNIVYHVLGEEAWGASYGFTIPDWFAEGDAVNTETLHTKGGRGRMPSFVSGYRALHQGGISWPYQKARNGSYKDLVPDHYVFGYTMVKYINDHFGTNQWNQVFNEGVRYKPLFFPFTAALKKHTGLTTAKLYNLSIATLKSDSLDSELADEIILKNNQPQVIKDFLSPYSLKDGSLIYLESSTNQLPTLFIQSPDGKHKRLLSPGITTDNDFTFKEPLACWTEITPDPRWDNRDYSDIYSYNIKNHLLKKVTNKKKYFRPSFSHDLGRIVAMEYLPGGNSSLVILNAAGVLLEGLKMDPGMLPTFPVFEPGDTSIAVVLRGHGYSSIKRYAVNGTSHRTLLNGINAIIANLSAVRETLYFSSDLSGRDNLYALDLKSNKLFQFTFNSIGIRQFHIRDNILWYNYQTASGIQIRKKKLSDCIFKEINIPSGNAELTAIPELRSVTSSGHQKITQASLFFNPFRVYSWTVRPDEGGNVFRVLGSNVMNTISGTSAYSYQRDEKSHNLSNSVSIGTAYPVLTATVTNSFNRRIYRLNQPGLDSIRWNETGLRVGASVPLTFYDHNQIIQIQPLLQFGQYLPGYKLGDRKNYQATNYIRSAMIFSSQQRKAKQQVSSRFAQRISLQWNRAVNNSADALDLLSSFNFPGLSKNHTIELNFNVHRQRLSDPYRFSIPSRFIDGYESFSSDRFLWSRAAYHFPLLYPDMGIPGLFFLKRIRTRLFGEMMNNVLVRNPQNLKVNYRSLGTELLFDGNLFNALPVSFGFRYNHILDTDLILKRKQPGVEFILEQLF